jgi:N-acyl-D-aspartate/D-glutamate deacylase
LTDSAARDQIKADFEQGRPDWENLQRAAGWEGIVISTCPGRPEFEGHSVTELAPGREADFVFDLLVEQEAKVTMIVHMMAEPDVRRVLGFEAAMIGSDGHTAARQAPPALGWDFRSRARSVLQGGALVRPGDRDPQDDRPGRRAVWTD